MDSDDQTNAPATSAGTDASPDPQADAAMTDAGASDVAGEPATAAASAQAHKPQKHSARIEHKVPGRIRMKVHTAKNDPQALEAYRQMLASAPGVRQVHAKPETGSIVIHYDVEHHHEIEDRLHAHCSEHLHVEAHAAPEDEVSELARRIEAEAEFLAERSQIARGAVDFFKGFDRELKSATDNTIDLKIVLAGGLAAFTFLEIGAEAATPMWVTLGLFTLNHFAELSHHDGPHPSRDLGV